MAKRWQQIVEIIKQLFLEQLLAMLLGDKREKLQLTLSREEPERMIERIVVKVLERQSQQMALNKQIKLISTGEICHELGISRQTLINW